MPTPNMDPTFDYTCRCGFQSTYRISPGAPSHGMGGPWEDSGPPEGPEVTFGPDACPDCNVPIQDGDILLAFEIAGTEVDHGN